MLYFCARVAGNSSLSYFRLALKLAAIGKYDLALDRMMKALQADKWNKMNNWGVALMTLFVSLIKSRQFRIPVQTSGTLYRSAAVLLMVLYAT